MFLSIASHTNDISVMAALQEYWSVFENNGNFCEKLESWKPDGCLGNVTDGHDSDCE